MQLNNTLEPSFIETLKLEFNTSNIKEAIHKLYQSYLDSKADMSDDRVLHVQKFKIDSVENIMDDFKKEDYSNDFLADLEEGLKKSSVYNGD